MPTDVIIDPSTGQIYWNDSTGSPQSISIKGDAINAISFVGYSGSFSPGSTPSGASTLVTVNDNSGTDALVPGTSGFNLGSSTLRWNTFATNANLSGTLVVSDSTISSSLLTGSVRFNGGIAISGNASIGQSLNFYNTAATFYTGFRAGTISANTLYTLPTAFPGSASVLQSDTSGTLTWVGSIGTATTATNVNVVSATTSASHPVLFTPATGTASGAAVSSEPTFVYNPSTDILSVSGLAITSVTASTTPTTGALIVSGGAGIAKTSYFGQDVKIQGTTPSTSSATGALVVSGGVGISESLNVGTRSTSGYGDVVGGFGGSINGTVAVAIRNFAPGSANYSRLILGNDSTLSIIRYSSSLDSFAPNRLEIMNISGDVDYRAATGYSHYFKIGTGSAFGSAIKMTIEEKGVSILSSSASTSTTTGALVVTGGAGIGGSIFGGSTISAADNVEIKSGKELRLNNTGNTFYTGIKAGANTSNTTYTFPIAFPGAGTSVLQSDTSGTLSWTGIVGNATTSTNINVVSASTSASHPVLFTPATGTASGAAVSTESTFVYNPSTDILSVSGLAVTATTASTTPTTGALIVAGGVGIGGSLSVGSYILLDNAYGSVTTTQYASIFAKAIGSNATSLMQVKGNDGTTGMGMKAQTGTNSLIYSNGQIDFRVGSTIRDLDVPTGGTTHMTLGTTGILTLSASIASTTTSTGALVVTGGVGIGGSLYVASATAISGVTINNGVITGNLTGTATTATNVNVNLVGNANVFHSVLLTPTISSAGSAISGNGTLTYNALTDILSTPGLAVTSGAISTSTTSGAFQVKGGIGITGNAFIGGTINVGSPITIPNGGTNASSFGQSGGFVYYDGTSLRLLAASGATINYTNGYYQFDNRVYATSFFGGGSQMPNGSGIAGRVTIWSGNNTIGSDAEFTYDSTSNTLTVLGNIIGIGFTASGIAATSTVDSTTVNTGGLIVSGGAGIAKSVSIGGYLQLFNTNNYTSFVSASTANTVYTLPPTSPATGSSVLQSTSAGVMSWVPASSGGVATGVASRMAYYASAGSAITDTYGFQYTSAGQGQTVSIFGGAAIGSTIFVVSTPSSTSIKVGIGVSNPQFELEVNGEISATNKSFVINHPTKSGMKLRYGSLEGPENGVYVRGISTSNIIELPDYWLGLVDYNTITVHLTPIGKNNSHYFIKCEDNKVYIGTSIFKKINCFYSIWAERKDVPKLIVEY
jgi:hypothetical protein